MKRLLKLLQYFFARQPARTVLLGAVPDRLAEPHWQTLHDMQQGGCADVRLHFILRADINQRTLLRHIAAGESMEYIVTAGRRRDTAIHGLMLEFDDMVVPEFVLEESETIIWKRGKT